MTSTVTLKEASSSSSSSSSPSSTSSLNSGQLPTTKRNSVNINNNNDTGSVKSGDLWLDNWGFPLDQLFKTAIKFYKDNEGKVFHPSYYERNQFLALVLLVKHGPFDPSKASPLGALDMIGRDRRQAWADLKDLSKQKAMSNFINLLNSSCPSFKPYIEAHKREKEERDRQRIKEEEEKNKKDKESKLKEEEESNRKRPEEYFLQEEQRRAIKEALNNQTYVQFKSYAEQQYPNDLEQQNILITKLQEQHYEQYMQQIVQQRLISNRMNGQSSISTPSSPSSSSSSNKSQNLESPLLRKDDSHASYQSTTGYSNNLPSTSSPTKGVSSPSSSSGFYSSTSSASPVASSVIRTNSLSQSTFQEASSNDKSPTRIYRIDEKVENVEHEQHKENVGSVHFMTTEGHNITGLGGSELVHRGKNGNDEAVDGAEAESDLSDDSAPEDYESVEAPQMWTTKEIVAFKESIRQINGDGIIKVGHGEIVTVRVPTHPEGTCIFWEFATDSYDIGFGLFFEWTKNPGTQVSVHISESEDDEEEEEDEIIGPNIGGNLPTDPEKGPHSSKCINGPDELPSAVIVPIYRRDCHEEVYAGSHSYPGKGAYLLKFDNSYSLWRSKTLYYRVYYTK